MKECEVCETPMEYPIYCLECGIEFCAYCKEEHSKTCKSEEFD